MNKGDTIDMARESLLTPAAYVPELHREALQIALKKACGLGDLVIDPVFIDQFAEIFQRQQLERVAVAMASGNGLAAFFEPGTRIQIKKEVRVKIEQVVNMLGDAVIRASSTPVGIEWSNVDPETRCAAHEAHGLFDQGRGGYNLPLKLMLDAFPVLPGSAAIPGCEEDRWNANEIWSWGQTRSSSQRDAVAFVLCIYNTKGPWAAEFNLFRAWANWDDKQRGVVQGWLDRPWWA